MKNRILTILALFLPLISVFAQVPPPPDQGEDVFTPGAPSTPVDQYIIFLMLVGVAFAGYFIWNQRKLVKN